MPLYGDLRCKTEQLSNSKTAAREGSPITLIDGNELVRLVIRYERYITPVKTYVLDEFYNAEE